MKNQLKTILLLGALSALVVGVGAAIAPGHLYLFGALALLMNLGAYFFSDRIVLKMHGAREVSPAEAPDLHRIVAELAARAELPMPRVCIMPDEQPNAFATGRNPAHGVVAVTEGILRLLTERELRGVLAHELAHIKNRDILVSSIAAAGAALISYIANALSFGALFGMSQSDDEEGSPAGGLLVALVAPIAATLIQLGISRSREYRADETGAAISGDPEALARALLKLEQGAHAMLPAQTSPATASLFIVNPFGALQRAAGWFSTHPSTEERVLRLRALARRGGHGLQPSAAV
jgi:heat shock protein HtpX